MCFEWLACWYHDIPGLQKQDHGLTQDQAARELQVSDTVVKTAHSGWHSTSDACCRICSLGDRAKKI